MKKDEVTRLSDQKIGSLLVGIARVEMIINSYIIRHFAWNSKQELRNEFIVWMLQESKIGLDAKVEIVNKIMKKHYPNELITIPKKRLKRFVQLRNILAHTTFAIDEENVENDNYSLKNVVIMRNMNDYEPLEKLEREINDITKKLREGLYSTELMKLSDPTH